MRVLIVGANFSNKGSQSMLFVTIDKIRKIYGDKTEIFYLTNELDDFSNYKFVPIYFNQYSKPLIITGGIQKMKLSLVGVFKSTIKYFLKKGNSPLEIFALSKIMKNIDLIVDISGFSLGSKWPIKSIENYLDNIRIAKKFNIPIYLMPQSFGPFSFGKNQEEMDEKIKKELAYPSLIFAREKEGYSILKNKYGLTNIKYSPDLVLQDEGINPQNVFCKVPELNFPMIKENNNVAVIPNMRVFDHGDKNKILLTYRGAIDELLKLNKIVYLFRHSYEDLVACKWIKEMYFDNDKVILIDNDFSCFEYDQFIKNFEFLIAGRFHSIVHAYKVGIPCIAFGWAVKYKELLKLLNQEEYVFDVTNTTESNQFNVFEMIRSMNTNLNINRELINKNIKRIQSNSCFIDLRDSLKRGN